MLSACSGLSGVVVPPPDRPVPFQPEVMVKCRDLGELPETMTYKEAIVELYGVVETYKGCKNPHNLLVDQIKSREHGETTKTP